MGTAKRNVIVEQVSNGKVLIERLVSDEQLENGLIGNIEIRNIHDSTVTISLNLQKSAEYSSYLKTLRLLQKEWDYTPTENIAERLSISKQINEQKDVIKSFEEDVLRIADKISQYELVTERLIKAVAYFEQGKIREADAVLDTQEIKEDLKLVRQREEKANKEVASAKQARKNIANQFTLKALIQASDQNNKNKFEHTVESFEASIDAFEYSDNCIAYADFLDRHHQNTKAKAFFYKGILHLKKEKKYEQLVNIYAKLTIIEANEHRSNESFVAIENATAILDAYKKEANDSLYKSIPDLLEGLTLLTYNTNQQHASSSNKKIREGLPQVKNKLVKLGGSFLQSKKNGFKSDPLLTGKILKSFAFYYLHNNEYKKAIQYFEKAIDFFKQLKVTGPGKDEELKNLIGECYTECHQCYRQSGKDDNYLESAADIYEKLSESNPSRYLLYIAYCKRLSGRVATQKGQFEKAEDKYIEALNIYKAYSAIEAPTFTYHAADICEDLADAYLKFDKKEQAIDALLACIEIYQQLYDAESNKYMTKMVSLLQKLIWLFYNAESSGLEWNDFMQKSFAVIQTEYSVFNLYYNLLEISNVYARNGKDHFVPWVLEYLAYSYSRQTKPNSYSTSIVIQALTYHGDILKESDAAGAIEKYKLALYFCEKDKDNLSAEELNRLQNEITNGIKSIVESQDKIPS